MEILHGNRRQMIAGLLAAGAGALAVTPASADTGKLSEADFKKLAAAPKSPGDHKMLAKYYRAKAAEHETEAKAYDALAATYAKGLTGTSEGQAHELSRTLKHMAEHSRDFAEAANDVAEVHEGIAQGPLA